MTGVIGDKPIIADKQWSWVLLFTSSTTLICCALPIALVTLGLGAVSAVMFANFPFLVVLAKHKALLFAGSGLMIAVSGWLLYRPGRACPIDPELARACETAHRWNTRIVVVSSLMWALGFVAAYLSLPMLEFYERFSG